MNFARTGKEAGDRADPVDCLLPCTANPTTRDTRLAAQYRAIINQSRRLAPRWNSGQAQDRDGRSTELHKYQLERPTYDL